MTTFANSKISGIISWIKETEEMIKMWENHLPDQAAKLNVVQFQDLKRDFVKQQLTELLQSQHNIADIEPFLQQAIMYLKKFDRKETKTGVLQKNLKEVERMIACT